jgi:hypothetical protein
MISDDGSLRRLESPQKYLVFSPGNGGGYCPHGSNEPPGLLLSNESHVMPMCVASFIACCEKSKWRITQALVVFSSLVILLLPWSSLNPYDNNRITTAVMANTRNGGGVWNSWTWMLKSPAAKVRGTKIKASSVRRARLSASVMLRLASRLDSSARRVC